LVFALKSEICHLVFLFAFQKSLECPCHGSGYDGEGVNFKGPAPRPMDRAEVKLDPEGQIVVNIARLFKAPKGERN